MYTSKSFRRTLLLGFMIAAFVPLICLGFISYTYLGHKVEEFVNQRNGLLAETVATDMSSYLRHPLTAVQQIAIMFDSESFSNPKINRILNTIARESDYLESIYVIDADKRIVNIGLGQQHSEVHDNYLGMDLSGLSVLKNIEYLQGPYWSNSFLSPVSGEKSIALIHAVGDKYIIGFINIGYLHSFISARSSRDDTSIIILDDTGNPVFHPQLEMVEAQHSFANISPHKQSQLGNFGTYEFILNATPYLGSTANIAETKWLVVVVQPLEMAKAPLRSMTRFFVFAAFFSVIIVVILAIRQSGRLLRPLNDLQKNIQAVADGDYQADISRQSYEEFEEVATHFRHMAAAIERREQLLEINEERLVSLLEVHNLKELSESELLQFALEQAVSLTRSEIGYLHMLAEDERIVTFTVWSQNIGEFCRKNDLSLEMLSELGLGRSSIDERKNIIKNAQNAYGGTGESEKLMVARQLSVPILDGAKIVAVVGVLNKESIYDKTDARQLSLYFNHTWDILQQKRYEKDRGRMAEQLAHAQRLEAIGTLAGGIAHDFNNVLMVILGNAELARDNIDKPERIRQDLDQIYKGALRARDLVNQILAFSRDKAEGLKPLDIRPIVKEAVKLLRSSIPTNIEIQHSIDTESHPVIAEPGQINQLIMNLATNAYQAMSSGEGVLEIRLRFVVLDSDLYKRGKLAVQAGGYMELTVKDSGKGIPENMVNRIFEPYFTTREKEQGTGLGLAVVHGVVKSLKGAVTVDSEVGEGTVFKVFLPVAQTVSQTEEQIVTGKLPGGNERILYIDDDESVAMVNSRNLESLGYSVTVFLSSREAFASFSESSERFDLVITDMAMPEMTGDVLSEKILQIRGDIPIILCTGYSETMDENRAMQLGIAEVMMKPITRFDLALTVRKILGFG